MNEATKAVIVKSTKVLATNAAKKFVADTKATAYGQVESAKTVVRLLIEQGYIDPAVFATKAGEKANADKIGEEKVRLMYLLHPLCNAAAMNRYLKDEGILEAKAISDEDCGY